MPANLVNRPLYMQWLERWRDQDVIKVVTGMRRCGKSSVLSLFRDELRNQGVGDRNIISINFESLDEEYPLDARPLYRYIVERLAPGTNYVFLDEVQHVRDFERVVDGLAVRDGVDLYITGSNAYFLSGELATLLTGRYVELRMLPFSFSEYVRAREGAGPSDALFNDYLLYGGLPFTTRLADAQSVADYLSGVFNTIVLQDVARRHPRMDMRSFMATSSFMADNVGNITSRKRIATTLTEAGSRTTPATVGDYIDVLRENYLLFRVDRYDVKGREYLKSLEKYYLGDLGFRFWLLGKAQGDAGHRLENAVFLELARRYRRVSVGRVGTAEADFVVQGATGRGNAGTEYFQVAQTVLDDDVRRREFAPLRSIADNYPKTVLSLIHI